MAQNYLEGKKKKVSRQTVETSPATVPEALPRDSGHLLTVYQMVYNLQVR